MRHGLVLGTVFGLLVTAVAAMWVLLGQDRQDNAKPIIIDARDPMLVNLGKRVYDEHCAACHGEHLEGEPDWRIRKADGRLPAPPHDANGHTWHHTDDVLFRVTKYGPAAVIGRAYESDMPAYQGILSDREILAALAFIKSTWPDDIRARHDAMNAAISRRNP